MDFDSAVKDIDEVTKKITVSIPADTVSKEIEVALNKVASSAQIKGFRPGKAPRDMIVKLHGERVRWEVTQRLISTSLGDVVKKNSFDYVGEPKVDIASEGDGKDLKFSADFVLYPNPEITGYDSLKIKVAKIEVPGSEVDDFLERMRESRATFRPLPGRDVAKEGDVVDLKVISSMDGGKPHEATPEKLTLGKKELPESLDQGIVGMKIGETKEISTDIGSSGEGETPQKVSYTVTLTALHEKLLPEIDDNFAKSIDQNTQTLLELRVKVRELLEKDKDRQRRSKADGQILKQLIERNDFKVPQVMVDDEIINLVIRSGVIDPKTFDPKTFQIEPFREKMGDLALERTKASIIVDRIAQKENLRAGEDDLKKWASEMYQSGVSDKELKSWVSDRQRLMSILLDLTRTKVLELIYNKASKEEVSQAELEKAEVEEKAAKPKMKAAKAGAEEDSAEKEAPKKKAKKAGKKEE